MLSNSQTRRQVPFHTEPAHNLTQARAHTTKHQQRPKTPNATSVNEDIASSVTIAGTNTTSIKPLKHQGWKRHPRRSHNYANTTKHTNATSENIANTFMKHAHTSPRPALTDRHQQIQKTPQEKSKGLEYCKKLKSSRVFLHQSLLAQSNPLCNPRKQLSHRKNLQEI